MLNSRVPLDLLKELETAFPPKCVQPFDDMPSAHHYSGKVALIQYLRSSYENQKRTDLNKPLSSLPPSPVGGEGTV